MEIPSIHISYFKTEAKVLFKQVRAEHPRAKERMLKVLKNAEGVGLMRVQHVVAVEAGFLKWEDLLAATEKDLRRAVTRSKNQKATPLGIFYRGVGILPATPQNEALADMFDKMTLLEQERFLNEDARRRGFFDR